MSAQTKYERYWERLMDEDLSQGFHATCETCGKNMDDETGDTCEKCKSNEMLEGVCDLCGEEFSELKAINSAPACGVCACEKCREKEIEEND